MTSRSAGTAAKNELGPKGDPLVSHSLRAVVWRIKRMQRPAQKPRILLSPNARHFALPLMLNVMRKHSRIPFFLAALSLQACFPFPHREPVAPQISGVVRDGAKPLAGITVRYAHSKPYNEPDCSHSDAKTRTGDDGRFAFKQGKEFRFFVFLGDPTYGYDICADREAGPALLWRERNFGAFERRAELECDVGSPVREGPKGRSRCLVRYPRAKQQ